MKPGFQVAGRMVSVVTRDGFRIAGFLTGSRKDRYCIVYIHGMGSNFYRKRVLLLADYLSKRGISFLSLDTRGHDSAATVQKENGDSRLIGTNFERFEESEFDIAAAIDALEGIGYDKVLLCGSSTGCQKSVYYQYRHKDRRVRGLILIGAGDDHNINRKELGKRFSGVAALCRKMLRERKGEMTNAMIPSGFSAQRFDSVANLKRVEARIFNYDGPMKEFGSLKVPVYAIFGSEEEYALKGVKEYLRILGERCSARFDSLIVKGGDHVLSGKEKELGAAIAKWTSSL